MSGGFYEYKQYVLDEIADSIQLEIEQNGSTEDDGFGHDRGRHYAPLVIDRMSEAVMALRIASTYAQRVDWLLSGDDSEDSFLRHLDEDLVHQEDAHARLFAAVPDMLAALLAFERATQLNNVCNDNPSASLEWMDASDYAVSKCDAVLQRLREAGVIAKTEETA